MPTPQPRMRRRRGGGRRTGHGSTAVGIAALRTLRSVHTVFGRGGGIIGAVSNAGHARATPRAARQAVPTPASTTAAANPQPDSRRAAPLRALSHQLIELGNARHFGVTELCTRTWGETANRLPTSHLRLQRPQMSQQRMRTQLATRTRHHKLIHSHLLTHRIPLVMRLTQPRQHIPIANRGHR